MPLRQPDQTVGAALLDRWHTRQTGFRELIDLLLADAEAAAGAGSSFQARWFLLGVPDHSLSLAELAGVLGLHHHGTNKVADWLGRGGID
jgi:hypothetical protein